MSHARPERLPRLSGKEALVLDLLSRQPGMYGLQLVEGSGGALKRGTVYVTLGRMAEKGYLVSRLDPAAPGNGGLPRRLYEPTALGLQLQRAFATLAHALRLETAR